MSKSKKATTKDELLMLKLFEMAEKAGDPQTEIDRYAIGKQIGQAAHAMDTIIKHLAQANFVKKGEGSAIFLTPNGIELVEHLLTER